MPKDRSAPAPTPALDKNEGSSSISVDQDIRYSARFWRVQRVAWGLMALVVLLALIGFFGGPGLSGTETASAEGVRVEYQAFGRYQAPMEYRLIFTGGEVVDGLSQVWLSEEMVSGLDLSTVVPAPRRASRGADWTILTFDPPPGPELVVTLRGKNTDIGPRSSEVRGPSGQAVHISQFIYP